MADRTYDWNGHINLPISYPDLSDFHMAGKVRMLMRSDLDHEGVVCGARDRIMCLSKEKADLTAEVERLRTGIKRLSDEEELSAETTGDDPLSMVYLAAKLAAAEAVNAELRKMMASLDWYWPEDDTSSEACADGPWQIAENHDAGPGEVFGYSRGGVIETRYFGYLDPAEDADSDDNFEVDEPTRDAAEAKIAAELARRAVLKPKGGAE